jgi:chromosome segregation ATPase
MRDAVDVARLACGADEVAGVLAERSEERAALVARLAEVETLSEERDAAIAQLNQALEHARAIVSGCAPEFESLRVEVGKLRAGLAHAESLALDRQRQLEHIHGLRAWKVLSKLMRWS